LIRPRSRSWRSRSGGWALTGWAPTGGSGLGLSIVSAIAAAHGGSLDLLARPAGGLRVVITLPLKAGLVPTGVVT
jgi:signal transduction histidine kinase